MLDRRKNAKLFSKPIASCKRIPRSVIGTGMEASTTTNFGADILAFTNAKVGAFVGASLEGAVLARRRDMNEAFYGRGATPEAIVLQGRHRNAKADPLRSVLAGL